MSKSTKLRCRAARRSLLMFCFVVHTSQYRLLRNPVTYTIDVLRPQYR